MDLECTFED